MRLAETFIRFVMNNTGESKNQFDGTSMATVRRCVELIIRATIFFLETIILL